MNAHSSDPWPLADARFSGVLFDNDGTLVSSIDAVVQCWLEWARELDVDPAGLVNMHGITAVDLVRRLVPADRYEYALQRINEIEAACEIPIEVLPGSVRALETLGDRCAIVTSAKADLFRRRAHGTGIPVPAVVVTAEDVHNGKPDPEGFLLGARRLGVPPQRCLVVEDAPAGVQAGHAAGALVLGIESHFDARTDIAGSLAAEAVVPNLDAVRFVLDGDEIAVRLGA
jgi:sugar-phosphatase